MSYVGTNYHGFQIQENALTVQAVFQQALYKLCPEEPDIKACSRTDSGVHAKKFCISFPYSGSLDNARLVTALNHLLPPDIRVLGAVTVPENFHARYSSVGKRYVYRIFTAEIMDPFLQGFALHYPVPFEIGRLNRAAALFIGEHDFHAFAGSKNTQTDTVRRISRSEFVPCDDEIRYIIEGNGFLYNMVRIIVGTLLNLPLGKISEEEILNALNHGTRTRYMPTAPAYGLYLDEVFYAPGDLTNDNT